MISIAINPRHQNKHPDPLPAGWWAWFNDGFVNAHLTIDQWAAHIQAGHACTTHHTGRRKAAHFTAGQHLGLDFDHLPAGATLQDVLHSDPFITRHAAILHTTASHTPEQPRARVLFVLEQPITDPQKYTLLARALLHHFQQADASCKDACRLFFGAAGCEMLTPGNVLPMHTAGHLIRAYLDDNPEPEQGTSSGKPAAAGDVPAAWLDGKRDHLIKLVEDAPDGQKYYTLRNIARTFGGYVKGGYYTEADAARWLKAAIGTRKETVKNMAAAYRTIEQGIAYGKNDPLYFTVPEPEPEPVLDIDALPDNSPAKAFFVAWQLQEMNQ